MRIIFCLIAISLLAACQNSNDSFAPESELVGAWILYEEGFSIGAGYSIVPVSENPPMSIFFSPDLQFSSTIVYWDNYRFYRIVNNGGKLELWLFKKEPDVTKEPEPTRLMYHFVIDDDRKLKLTPAFPSVCTEGCHMGFRR